MKNVLITGGAGFIGSNLALKLVTYGYKVTVMDNLSEQIHGKDPERSFLYRTIKEKVRFIKGDVRDRESWISALANQDAVIHYAAETGTGQSMYQIHKYSDVNIGGTAMLLDILASNHHTIKKIVVASSRAIYGEGCYSCHVHGEVFPSSRDETDLVKGNFECKCPICGTTVNLRPTHEDSICNSSSVYGVTKYFQEKLLLTAGKSLNIPVVAFRYQNVYGPGQSLSNPYTGILSIFSTQIKNNNTINIFEDGKESRDFVYIEDVVDATILGIKNEKANFKVYNVGSGNAVDVITIARKLATLYKSEVNIEITKKFRLGDIRHNYADLTRIKKDLNFVPKISFDEGIGNFVNWVNTQEITVDNYSKSIEELQIRGLIK
jgi:dTDP-L-rhamnose 4-epimerase